MSTFCVKWAEIFIIPGATGSQKAPFCTVGENTVFLIIPSAWFYYFKIGRNGNNMSWLQTAVHESGIETIVQCSGVFAPS